MDRITYFPTLSAIDPVSNSRLVIAALSLLATLSLPAIAKEVFILEGGGTISGELLKKDQLPRDEYIVRTSEGVVFKLDRSQVVEHEYKRPEESEYERIWPSFADTVEAQWEIAE